MTAAASDTARRQQLERLRNRSDLKLARLARRERAQRNHAQFAIGQLLELADHDTAGTEQLASLARSVGERLGNRAEHERMRSIGEKRLRGGAGTRPTALPEDLSPRAFRTRTHRLISAGAIFETHGLSDVDHALVLGALLDARHESATDATSPN